MSTVSIRVFGWYQAARRKPESYTGVRKKKRAISWSFLPNYGELAHSLSPAVVDNDLAIRAEVEAELGEEGRSRGTRGAVGAVLTLERDAETVGSGRAEKPLGSALGAEAFERPHQLGVRAAFAGD